MQAFEPPKTFPELIETGEKLKAKGIIPIALGGQPTWEHNLFRAVLVGTWRRRHVPPALWRPQAGRC